MCVHLCKSCCTFSVFTIWGGPQSSKKQLKAFTSKKLNDQIACGVVLQSSSVYPWRGIQQGPCPTHEHSWPIPPALCRATFCKKKQKAKVTEITIHITFGCKIPQPFQKENNPQEGGENRTVLIPHVIASLPICREAYKSRFSNHYQSMSKACTTYCSDSFLFYKMGRPTSCEIVATPATTKSAFRLPTQRRKVQRRLTCSSRGFISPSTNSATLQDHPPWRRRSVKRMIDGFTTLRSLLPKRCNGEAPTKVQTLQMATQYIRDLSCILKESEEKRDDFDLSDFSETSSQSCLSFLSSDSGFDDDFLNLFEPSVFDFADDVYQQKTCAVVPRVSDNTPASASFRQALCIWNWTKTRENHALKRYNAMAK